ncbi:unnamed protein product [Brassica oleracea]
MHSSNQEIPRDEEPQFCNFARDMGIITIGVLLPTDQQLDDHIVPKKTNSNSLGDKARKASVFTHHVSENQRTSSGGYLHAGERGFICPTEAATFHPSSKAIDDPTTTEERSAAHESRALPANTHQTFMSPFMSSKGETFDIHLTSGEVWSHPSTESLTVPTRAPLLSNLKHKPSHPS